MSYDAKVFCGTFSRNGKHFVTAGQGEVEVNDERTVNQVYLIILPFFCRQHDSYLRFNDGKI